MTTRIYIDNQTNILYKLTDSDGNKYGYVQPLTYTTLVVPYYGATGLAIVKYRDFTLTSKTPAKPGYIEFSVDNRGTLATYKLAATPIDGVATAISVTTTTLKSTVSGSTTNQESHTSVTNSSSSASISVNAAITSKKNVTIPLLENTGFNTTVQANSFTTSIVSPADDTIVLFSGYKYDRKYSQ